jgi:glutathione S-transferase
MNGPLVAFKLRRDLEDRKDCRQAPHDRQADRSSSSRNLLEVARQLEASGPGAVLQLDEVTLVDLDVVRFLNRCETEGVRLVNCSPYIREWMSREQNRSRG